MPVKQQPAGPAGRGMMDEPEFKRYVGILRRRVWAVVTALVIVVTLGTVHAFKATPVYWAGAKILIEKQTPKVMNYEDVMQLHAADRDYYRTQKELVKSQAVLQKAVGQPGMRELLEGMGEGSGAGGLASLVGEIRRTVAAVIGAQPASPPELWQRLRDMVEVEQIQGTQLLQVAVENPSPERAALVANSVARSFEQYHLERKLQTSNDAFKFLQGQGAEQEQELLGAEAALQQFREDVRVVSLDMADARNPLLLRLGRLSSQLTKAQLERIELEAGFHVVQGALESDAEGRGLGDEPLFSLPEVRNDPTLVMLRAKLVQAEQEEGALADIYGPEHPQFLVVRTKAELLRAELRQALTQLVASLSAELVALRNQELALKEEYDQENQLALEMAKQSLTYNRLQNEVIRQRKLFDVLVERMREVDLSADYGKTNIEVVESAEVAHAPFKPRKARLVLLSTVVGLLSGIGLAFFFEYMDDTVKTPEDMEARVGIPVLGFVPAMSSLDGEADDFAYKGMVCAVDPTCSATEAYRNIRTSLFFSAPAEQSKVLVVTSGGPGDGKTTTAANLALVMAQSGQRVLLMDADFRRPTVHKIFGLDARSGVSTILVNGCSLAEAVQKAHNNGEVIENLDVLPVGPKPPNPAELLDSQSMRGLLAEVREKYDRVVIDTPPVLFVADATILGAISDGVIMVVKSAVNSRSLARRAKEQLEGVNARILGGVLNDVHISQLGYYYSDYYYYGYSRYYRDYYGSYYSAEDRKD